MATDAHLGIRVQTRVGFEELACFERLAAERDHTVAHLLRRFIRWANSDPDGLDRFLAMRPPPSMCRWAKSGEVFSAQWAPKLLNFRIRQLQLDLRRGSQ